MKLEGLFKDLGRLAAQGYDDLELYIIKIKLQIMIDRIERIL